MKVENLAECKVSTVICSIPVCSNSLAPKQSEGIMQNTGIENINEGSPAPIQSEGTLVKIENMAVCDGSPCSLAPTHPDEILLKIENNTSSDGSSCSSAPTQTEGILQKTENMEGLDQPGSYSGHTVGTPVGILHLLDKLETFIDKLLPG